MIHSIRSFLNDALGRFTTPEIFFLTVLHYPIRRYGFSRSELILLDRQTPVIKTSSLYLFAKSIYLYI